MPARYLYTYTVMGSHDFPTDMLRYDSCWPASEQDSVQLNPHPRTETYRSTRYVTVTGLKEPTDGRWQSFGWRVSGETMRRKMA